MYLIRELKPSDLSSVYLINQANVPAVGQESEASFTSLYEQCELALVLEVDDKIQGFCIVLSPQSDYQSPNYLYFKDRYSQFIYLDRIALSSAVQGRGYGPLLYKEIEQRLRPERFTLEVNIKPPNEGSLRFHLREGFKVIAEEETRPGKIVALMLRESL
ncbi:MAG: hypothetical protein CMH49_04050 [Myxococcales bacterium]|nr:hypothetical protein [Myxococcales bacterium]